MMSVVPKFSDDAGLGDDLGTDEKSSGLNTIVKPPSPEKLTMSLAEKGYWTPFSIFLLLIKVPLVLPKSRT